MSGNSMQDSKNLEFHLELFFTAHLGEGWQFEPIVFLDGLKTIEALWPMNEVFRSYEALINSMPYSAEYERQADDALGLLAQGREWTVDYPSPGVWRVLQERHVQAMTVAAANAAAGNAKVVPLPQRLPAQHHRIAAMLFLQWAMVLPWPPASVSSFPWPAAVQPANLLRH